MSACALSKVNVSEPKNFIPVITVSQVGAPSPAEPIKPIHHNESASDYVAAFRCDDCGEPADEKNLTLVIDDILCDQCYGKLGLVLSPVQSQKGVEMSNSKLPHAFCKELHSADRESCSYCRGFMAGLNFAKENVKEIIKAVEEEQIDWDNIKIGGTD